MRAKHVEIVGYFDQFSEKQMQEIKELPEYHSFIDAQQKLNCLVSHAIFEQKGLSDDTILEWNREVVAKGNIMRDAIYDKNIIPLPN